MDRIEENAQIADAPRDGTGVVEGGREWEHS
jgi:hypothetical protein